MSRMEESRISKVAKDYNPIGRIKVGGPKKRWILEQAAQA